MSHEVTLHAENEMERRSSVSNGKVNPMLRNSKLANMFL